MATVSDHHRNVLQNPAQHGPRTQQVGHQGATSGGVIALLCASLALISAPLLLIPYAGFLPASIAGTGAFIAFRCLHRSSHRTGITTAGLITTVVVFALLAGIATVWTVLIADPAVRDYQELHDVIEYIRDLVF